jgi:hypothetical protein
MAAPLAVVDSARSRNRLGIAGFVCSLLGIVTLGLLSPLAFLLSAIALRKRPRGYAWAGTALGLVGTALLVVVVALGGFALVFLAFAGIFAAVAAQIAPLMGAADAIDKHMAVHGSLPAVAEGEASRICGDIAAMFGLGTLPARLWDQITFSIRSTTSFRATAKTAAQRPAAASTPDDVISEPIPANPPPVRK